jgi:hypothetical protein
MKEWLSAAKRRTHSGICSVAFNNVNRKRKIPSAVAVVVLGAVVWALSSAEEERTVRINYVGVSTNDPSLVRFAIANAHRSKRISLYSFYWQDDQTAGLLTTPDSVASAITPAATSEVFRYPVPSTNRWKLVMTYYPVRKDSLLRRAQRQLGNARQQAGGGL